MKYIAKKMDFDVISDLHNKNSREYNIQLELENEIDSTTREMAVALSGAIVRNFHKNMYEEISSEKDLAEFIKERLNAWVPNVDFKVNDVVLSQKQNKVRV